MLPSAAPPASPATMEECAPERPQQGPTFGLRVGYGVPFGSANGSSLRDVASGMTPIWFDAGYRISPHWYVGADLIYAIAFISPNSQLCSDPTLTCHGHQWRFGLDAVYHLLPASKFDPWGGFGAGYEVLDISATSVDFGDTV